MQCAFQLNERLANKHSVLSLTLYPWQKGMLMQLDSCDHLHVVCAVPRRQGWSFPAFSMWYCIDIGQQKNNETAEEQKLKEPIYLFGHPLAGNFKMKHHQGSCVCLGHMWYREIFAQYISEMGSKPFF